MDNSLVKTAGPITVKSATEAMAFAKLLGNTEMVPRAYRGRHADIVGAIIYGSRFGLDPFQAMGAIAVINGNPTMWGDAVLALVRQSGVLDPQFGNGGIKERTPADSLAAGEGRCEVMVKGWGEPLVRTFSMAEAEAAGLIARAKGTGRGDGPWITYPGRMLQMRARSWALRDACPEVLRGIKVREEVEDIQEADAEVKEPRRQSELTQQDVDGFLREVGQQAGPAPQRASGAAPQSGGCGVMEGKIEKIETVTAKDKKKCASCHGSGKNGGRACRDCAGTGHLNEPAWSLYVIHVEGAGKAGTFDTKIRDAAEVIRQAGGKARIPWKMTDKGNMNAEAVEPIESESALVQSEPGELG